jgi:hypothetical protein
MLIAYDDRGLTIKDTPGDETRVDLYPIEKLGKLGGQTRETRGTGTCEEIGF